LGLPEIAQASVPEQSFEVEIYEIKGEDVHRIREIKLYLKDEKKPFININLNNSFATNGINLMY